MIRIILCITALTVLLAGCSVHQSFGRSFGSGVWTPKGQAFSAPAASQNAAILYVYRPATQWSLDEMESPSFNINDKRLFNLKGGGYSWYELAPGRFDIVMRRGLLGFEGVNSWVIKTVAQLRLDAKPGQVYYLRYSEVETVATAPGMPVSHGPLQLVSAKQALQELADARLQHHSRQRLSPRKQVQDKDLEQVFEGKMQVK